MTIPSLPYDSFYKFLFISGIILIITGLYLRNDFVTKIPDTTAKIDSITQNYSMVRLNLSFKKSMDSALVSQDTNLTPRSSISDVAQIKSKYKSDSIKIRNGVLANQYLLRYHLPNYHTSLLLRFEIMWWSGIIIVLVGGFFWHRQQIVQDKIQITQLKILEKQLSEKKESNRYGRR